MGVPFVVPPPLPTEANLYQYHEIEGQYAQREEEARQCEPSVPSIVVFGPVKELRLSVTPLHRPTRYPLRCLLRE